MKNNSIAELRLGIMQDMLKTLNELEKSEKPTRKPRKPMEAKPTANKPNAEPAKPKADKPKREHKRHCGIMVRDQRALYALADAEMLHTLYSVSPDTEFPGANVYFVEDTEKTRAILAPFMPELRHPKGERHE